MEKVVKSTLEAEYEGSIWVAEWCSFIIHDGSESFDRWLKVSRKEESGALTDLDSIHDIYGDKKESKKASAIIRLLTDKRVKEIQAEYNIPSESTDELAVTEHILARVWDGEWMGQNRNSYYFFIDTIGEILNKDFLEAAQIIKTLTVQEKAGLNGFIVVPWKEEDDAFKSWEKATGHKKLYVSDGAGWSCDYCCNRTDEYGPSASEVPCVLAETKEVEV